MKSITARACGQLCADVEKKHDAKSRSSGGKQNRKNGRRADGPDKKHLMLGHESVAVRDDAGFLEREGLIPMREEAFLLLVPRSELEDGFRPPSFVAVELEEGA